MRIMAHDTHGSSALATGISHESVMVLMVLSCAPQRSAPPRRSRARTLAASLPPPLRTRETAPP